MEFLEWMVTMGYLTEEDVKDDGNEIIKDLEKIKEIVSKFYKLIKIIFTTR